VSCADTDYTESVRQSSHSGLDLFRSVQTKAERASTYLAAHILKSNFLILFLDGFYASMAIRNVAAIQDHSAFFAFQVGLSVAKRN